MAETSPSETLYIRGIPEKVKIPNLKETLRTVYQEYGQVLDIVAHKNIRMRGQAFVVFSTVAEAEQAFVGTQGLLLYDQAVSILFAKSKSDETVKRQNPDEYKAHKRQRLEKKYQLKQQMKQQREAAEATQAKQPKKPVAAAARKPAGRPAAADENLPPHKILFIQNLPEDITVEVLNAVFGRYAGFVESRMVPGRAGIAFVEYDSDEEAAAARTRTLGMRLGENKVKVSFGKKT